MFSARASLRVSAEVSIQPGLNRPSARRSAGHSRVDLTSGNCTCSAESGRQSASVNGCSWADGSSRFTCPSGARSSRCNTVKKRACKGGRRAMVAPSPRRTSVVSSFACFPSSTFADVGSCCECLAERRKREANLSSNSAETASGAPTPTTAKARSKSALPTVGSRAIQVFPAVSVSADTASGRRCWWIGLARSSTECFR